MGKELEEWRGLVCERAFCGQMGKEFISKLEFEMSATCAGAVCRDGFESHLPRFLLSFPQSWAQWREDGF